MIIPESYEQFPEGTYGYVYQTTHIPSGKKYVGKKALIYNIKRKLGKKELALHEGKGRPPKFKIVQKESDWKTYYGSHKFIKEEIKKGKQSDFERAILQYAFSKKQLTYLENKALFSLGVLEREEYLNDNIEGRYFKKDFDLTDEFSTFNV
tara:strand:+ start:35 stop:487 length:453 start_codon:yes stop_codon:yes gene_type:complete